MTKLSFLSADNKNNFILALIIGLSIFWGIASFQHYGPNNYDISVNLFVAVITACAFLYAPYTQYYNKLQITVGTMCCFFLLVLLIIQPFLSDILYPDALIFPIAEMVYALLIGLLVFNNTNRDFLVTIITACIAISALFTVVTLLIQAFDVQFFYNLIVTPVPVGGRPVGNVSQPNQAAFVLSLGIVAIFYFIDTIKNKYLNFVLIIMLIFLSLGIALTSSRTGIILIGFSILFYWGLSTKISLFTRLKSIIFYSLLSSMGYFVGNSILDINKTSVSTGIERLSGNMIELRQSQLNQGMLIFQDNWLKGVGWDNFAASGLEYAEQVSWFAFSSHSHMIISNIASEMGILGLVGFLGIVIVLVFRFFKIASKIETLSMSMCLIILAYSFSEYPLWYLKYLLIFAIFFSVLDISIKKSFVNKSLFTVVGLLLLIGSSYYTVQYRNFLGIYTQFTATDNNEDKIALYNSYHQPFGFLDYKETLLFGAFPIDKDQIGLKVEVGSRVVKSSPAPAYLNKQAVFYGLNNQPVESLRLFKASCLYSFGISCDEVLEAIVIAKGVYPNEFSSIHNQFMNWRSDNPEKTNLINK